MVETPQAPLTGAAIAAHLHTRWLGRALHCFAELDSTNTTARELAAGGAPDGTVVIADAQRHGRGRLGRQWVSPAGRNLYLSVALRDAGPPEHLGQLSLLAGVATAETVRAWCPAAVIKWPNDVLIDGRKAAGILCEMEPAGSARVVVLGIGVNLNGGPDDFPAELRDKATSLALAGGAPVDRARVAAALLDALEAHVERWRRDGFAPIAAAWRALAAMLGRPIRVAEPDGTVEGVAEDLADDGALLVRRADGRLHRVVAGDVTVLDGYARPGP